MNIEVADIVLSQFPWFVRRGNKAPIAKTATKPCAAVFLMEKSFVCVDFTSS